MYQRPLKEDHHGFTLLELMVVMAIVGLMAGYVGPRLFGQLAKSEAKVAKAQLDALQKALDLYRIDVGRYPSTSQGLGVLIIFAPGNQGWAGPYLSKVVPADPWGRAYQYRSPGEHGDYDLFSLGRDGKPGGSKEDADITSW
jgi:general secretion pathway protein G